MLDLLRNIKTLEQAEELLEEVIVVNNCSTENYEPVKEFIASEPAIPFRYFDAPENLGVAKGRNFALQKGKAPLVIMLDDDAVLQNKDCLLNLIAEFNLSNTERPKAIVTFKVLYYDTLEMQVNAFPHKKFSNYKNKSFFETYFYAGGAHAVKREVIEKLGYYAAGFFYGMEEYDLSYRILNAGYSIVYSDKIVMLHKESPKGRTTKEEKFRMMWVNKAIVAYRYLPKKYFFSTAFLWCLFYLKKAGFNFKLLMAGLKKIMAISKTEKRNVVSEHTLAYLKKVKARLWY
ncbi:MAG: glycosyltransferase [Chitinophagaceae bacterium]|nr:glycosyltransferase [Chitinophagaceae bacterium]